MVKNKQKESHPKYLKWMRTDDDMSGRGGLRRRQGDKNHRFLTKCRKTVAKMYRIEQREQRF